MEFARDTKAEIMLDEMGVEWELRQADPKEDVNKEKSRLNQARFSRIDNRKVEQFVALDKAGSAKWPAVIARETSNGLVLSDGNTRHEMFLRNGHKKMWAYVYRGDDEVFRAISDYANTRLNGTENTEEERMQHAIDAVNRGVDRSTAARQFRISPTDLTTRLKYIRQRERFAKLGIKLREYQGMSESMVIRVASAASDGVVSKALAATRRYGPTVVAQALREAGLDASTTKERENAQAAALDRLEERMTSAAGLVVPKKKVSDPDDILAMQLSGALAAVQKALKKGEALTEKQQVVLLRIKAMLCDS